MRSERGLCFGPYEWATSATASFSRERFNVCTSRLAVTRCVWRPVHVWRPQLSPPPLYNALAYESSVWSPAAPVMGAGGGGGAAAAVRRIVDTVRKYKEVRSVEVRSVEDGVRDGLGEGVVEAEADESALPPDEGDHQLCNQRCNQHAINDELALPPDEGDHQHAIRDAISMQSACNQRRVGTPTSAPTNFAPSTGGRATREPRG